MTSLDKFLSSFMFLIFENTEGLLLWAIFFQETHFEVVYFLTFWKKLKPWTFEEANLIRRNIGMFDLPCTLKNLRTV